MRKSRIFLVAAGLLVAVGGAFATKAVNKIAPTTVRYLSGAACTTTVVETAPCVGNNFDCTTLINGQTKTIFSDVNCALPYRKATP